MTTGFYIPRRLWNNFFSSQFDYLLLIGAWSLFAIYLIFITDMWAGGGRYYMDNGDLKTGDLYKHYATHHFIEKGDWRHIYDKEIFGGWCRESTKNLVQTLKDKGLIPSQFLKSDSDTSSSSTLPQSISASSKTVPYVYPPLVAFFANYFYTSDYFIWPHAWLFFSIACYVVAFVIASRSQPELKLLEPHRAVLFFAFPGIYYCLWIMQNGALTLPFIFWAGYLLNQKKEMQAAIVLSALFYKPQILFVIVIVMFVVGRIRFAFQVGFLSALWVLAGVLLCGFSSYIDWISVLREKLRGDYPGNSHMGIDFISFYTYFHFPESLPYWLVHYVGLTGLFLTVGTAWLFRSSILRRNWKPSYLLYLAAALWIGFAPGIFYYEWMLTIPWFYVCGTQFKRRPVEYLLLISYVLISISLILPPFLVWLPPIGALFCPLWVALSIAYALKKLFPLELKASK